MFLLTLFNVTQPYSTKELAEKTASHFIIKLMELARGTMSVSQKALFSQAYQREQFSQCVMIWNDHVQMEMYGNSLHRITIREVKLDAPFA